MKKNLGKLKILLTRKLDKSSINELSKHYKVEVHSGQIPMPKKKLLEKIRDKNGLICFPYDVIDKQVLSTASELKAISTYSVGFDHIDVRFAKQKKIRIGYTPEVLTDTTADLTISLILDLLRRVSEGDRLIRNGNWEEIFGAFENLGTDLTEKTLGILGFGRIGKAVAKRASVFGMNIIYHNRTRLTKTAEKKTHVKYVTPDELFKESDIISIHVPYTKKTNQLVNMKLIKKMKKTAFLINTSRGKIINENDLILALRRKIISGVALDVFENEPIHKNHPLLKMKNVVLTPHAGSSTLETRKKMAEITVQNLKLGLAGKKPIFSVN